MNNPLIRKLESFTRLSPEDRRVLMAAGQRRTRRLGAREDIICEGDRPEEVNLIVEGWACRYKMLEDGRRQIIALFVPGDLCDLNIFLLREMDHSIAAITPVKIAGISREMLHAMTTESPRLNEALWWETLVVAAIQREWTVSLGQRSAIERIGHLMCELMLRLRSVGLSDGISCDFPITQNDLADATGLTSVHVNRTLQELRASGLISLQSRRLIVHDLAALQAASFFNPNYLHLDHDGKHLDALPC